MVLTSTPMVSFNRSSRSRCTGVNKLTDASSITASTSPSNSTGTMATFVGEVAPSPELIRT